MFDKDPPTALEAIAAAQALAFAPIAFHATLVLRDRGVLAALAQAVPHGLGIDDVAAATGLSIYASRVLLEAGLGLHIVWRRDERFHLGKLGHFLLDDTMTRVNFDFTRDVCYQAAAHLDESLVQGKPAGLKTIGPWRTLYEGLSDMPEPARKSWFDFDHFYSDQAFPEVCKRLAADPPARLLDVGANTGKFARMCLERLPATTKIGLADLPIQLAAAKKNLGEVDPTGRVSYFPVDLLNPGIPLPGGHPLIWMSQLLD